MSDDTHTTPDGGLTRPEDFPSEADHRFSVFKSWCSRLAGRCVGIYGSGANARRILSCAELACERLIPIDDKSAGTELCGKDVTNLEDALALGMDVLVMAATSRSAHTVYRRISPICAQRGIDVLDMYGNDLASLESRLDSACAQTLTEQLALLEANDVICVDASLLQSGVRGTTISDCLRSGSTLDRCLPAVLDALSANGKTLVLCSSDLTVTRKEALGMIECLTNKGQVRLLLASELGLTAENGLYRILGDAFEGSDIVHVVDMRDAQFMAGIFPLAFGYDVVLAGMLPNGVRGCGESTPGSRGEGTGRVGSTQAQERLERAAGRAGEKDRGELAPLLARLVIGFVTWLASSLDSDRDCAEVLFAARDGYVVKGVYDLLRCHAPMLSLPPSRYFYASRKACGKASEDAAGRASYLKYLSSCGLGLGKTYAFVEFVGAGTCQTLIEAFAPFRLRGFYFGSRVGDLLGCAVESKCYFDNGADDFLSRYLALEPYMSAPEPSLEGFSEEGVPIFAEELRSQGELEELALVHKSVLLIAEEFFSHGYQDGDVIDSEHINALMPGLDLCDTSRMSLYDDLDGRRLSKSITENQALSARQAKASLDAVLSSEPRETDLQVIHRLLLDMLQTFDGICAEYGLSYIATHGTLLGAVRDGGFIPWDDDIDIAMPRPDFDKLAEIAKAGALPHPYHLQTTENDHTNFYGGYAKLRVLTEEARRFEDGWRNPKSGVHIDIFPLDNCPTDERECARRRRRVRFWQKMLCAKANRNDLSAFWDTNPRKVSFFFLLSDCISHKRLCRGLHDACVSTGQTGRLAILAGNFRSRFDDSVFQLDDVAHPLRVPFESIEVPIPRNAEAWLARYYGPNWRSAVQDDEDSA